MTQKKVFLDIHHQKKKKKFVRTKKRCVQTFDLNNVIILLVLALELVTNFDAELGLDPLPPGVESNN